MALLQSVQGVTGAKGLTFVNIKHSSKLTVGTRQHFKSFK